MCQFLQVLFLTSWRVMQTTPPAHPLLTLAFWVFFQHTRHIPTSELLFLLSPLLVPRYCQGSPSHLLQTFVHLSLGLPWHPLKNSKLLPACLLPLLFFPLLFFSITLPTIWHIVYLSYLLVYTPLRWKGFLCIVTISIFPVPELNKYLLNKCINKFWSFLNFFRARQKNKSFNMFSTKSE